MKQILIGEVAAWIVARERSDNPKRYEAIRERVEAVRCGGLAVPPDMVGPRQLHWQEMAGEPRKIVLCGTWDQWGFVDVTESLFKVWVEMPESMLANHLSRLDDGVRLGEIIDAPFLSERRVRSIVADVDAQGRRAVTCHLHGPEAHVTWEEFLLKIDGMVFDKPRFLESIIGNGP